MLRASADAGQPALAAHPKAVALSLGTLLATSRNHPVLDRIAGLQRAQLAQPAIGIVALRHRPALDRRLRPAIASPEQAHIACGPARLGEKADANHITADWIARHTLIRPGEVWRIGAGWLVNNGEWFAHYLQLL